MKWWDQMPWSSFFECWVLNQLFHSPLSSSSRCSLVPLCFLPLEWCHLHIWRYWYFSQKSWFQLELHPAQHFMWWTLQFNKQVTIYSLAILLSQFGTSSFFQSGSNCFFLNCMQISQEAGKVVWYSHLFQNFPQFIVIYTVKGFGIGIINMKYMNFIFHI